MIHKIREIIVYSIVFIFILKSNFYDCKEKKLVMDIQRPVCATYDLSYVKNLSCSSKRYNRTDRSHYVSIYAESVRDTDESFIIHFYFYQLLTNVYKRSFVEYGYKLCYIFNEKIMGPMLMEAYYRNPESQRPMKTFGCPILPGHYHFANMKVPLIALPATFPFSEGRIYINVTRHGRVLISGHLDFVFI